MKMNKMREQISQAFLEALKENEIPWQRGWMAERPINAVSNTEYRGVNNFWLSYTAEQKGYSDPRWCTFKQAKDNDWHIKKGEKGTHVEFWSMYDTETKKKLTARESNLLREELEEDFYKRVKPISSVYTVFNAEQIEGIPEREKTHESIRSDELIQKRDTLIKNMGFTFHEGGDRAFYRMGDDSVTLPQMDQFRSVYDYMSVFLHESGHATGHKDRMNRDLSGGFGSESYAREELRAEIASAFTSQTLGLGEMEEGHMNNHKAYIQSWINVLQKEPQELFDAIRDAEKISDYLIEKGEFFPEKQKKAELDKQKQQYVTEHQKTLDEIPLEKTPVVINAFGGPGSGKSTACMDICQQLKKLGYNAEYVQEYAKELVYDKNWEMLDGSEAHQFEMLKEQVHRMDRLYGQADFIVTDSPVLLNTIYNQELTAAYSGMVQELHGQYHNFSFFVERDRTSFQQEGRIHNLEESILKDKEIQTLLKNNDIYYGTYTHETIGKVVQNAITTYHGLNQGTDGEKKEPGLEESINKTSQEVKPAIEEKFMTVSENLAGKLWDEECSIYTREGDGTHLIDSRSELYRAGKKETLYVREGDFQECMKKEFFPTVTCEWSSHSSFHGGKTYLISEFNDKMKKARPEEYRPDHWTPGVGSGSINYEESQYKVNLSADGNSFTRRYTPGFIDSINEHLTVFETEGSEREGRERSEQLEQDSAWEKEFMDYQEKLNGIFEQEEGHLPHPEHAMGNCQDEVLNTIQKQINRGRSRQVTSKPVNRHLERMK